MYFLYICMVRLFLPVTYKVTEKTLSNSVKKILSNLPPVQCMDVTAVTTIAFSSTKYV